MSATNRAARGRPAGRTGQTWSIYLTPRSIAILKRAAARRGMTPGRYLEAIADLLDFQPGNEQGG